MTNYDLCPGRAVNCKRLRQENGDIELSLNVQNIFDDPYWEFTPTTGSDVNGNLAERRIYAQVKVSLR